MHFPRLKLRKFTLCFCTIFLLTIIIIHLIKIDEADIAKKKFRNHAHKLCIIVPFRDRFEELLQFLPHMRNFLQRQKIYHNIYVINQIDNLRFNRGSLINVGFLYVRAYDRKCDYIAMHDVDLLPLNEQLLYYYPLSGSYLVSSPNLHPLYNYSTFIGGILILKMEDFEKVNGVSNKYWGWGLEDDEFYLRLKEANITIDRPGNLSTGTNGTFRHIHSKKRKRDTSKCFNQKLATRKRDRETGLNNVNYSLQSNYSLSINGASGTILNVRLICDRKITPWCLCR